jgi:hypothetical protein
MGFESLQKHQQRYVVPHDLQQRLPDIRTALAAITVLPIGATLKKDLLDELLWQVTYATGNTQKKFMGPYRSERVITEVGLPIERDHVYQRKTLLQLLLGPAPDLDEILKLAQCCVVLTADEHRRVSDIDGVEDTPTPEFASTTWLS